MTVRFSVSLFRAKFTCIMFSFFKKSVNEMRGYKITTVDRKKKYGIAANSLKVLKQKAEDKLGVKKMSFSF